MTAVIKIDYSNNVLHLTKVNSYNLFFSHSM